VNWVVDFAASRSTKDRSTRRAAARGGARGESAVTRNRIEVENPNRPGQLGSVDADRYEAMKRAYLKVLPKTPPGLTLAEIRDRLIAHLPEDQFPGGAKAGWWAKTVQLDLEAKGVIVRAKTRPLRLRRA
jgi:hypothetical protein